MANPVMYSNATDAFISDNLPAWLHAASVEQIGALQARFAAYRTTEATLHKALQQLKAPHEYARMLLNQAVKAQLKLEFDLVNALWRQHWDKYSLLGGESFVNHYTIEPALHHVLQNFPEGMLYDAKTGLIAGGHDAFLTTKHLLIETSKFVQMCRKEDAGQRYQAHLDTVLDAAFGEALKLEKRQRLELSINLAHLQSKLSDAELALLSPVQSIGSRVTVKHLHMLGCALQGGLALEVTVDAEGTALAHALIALYLPHRPLQCFDSWAALSAHLLSLLRDTHEQAKLLALIALKDRITVHTTLGKRLRDPVPDLEVSGRVAASDLFDELARMQLQRMRSDARYLLVPVADVDDQSKWQRLQTLESVGMNLLQMAGLFVPVLGQLLTAEMVVEVIKEVYEGVGDWQRGHQHEALEHMLGVAEVVAVNTLAAAGGAAVARGFERSAFVDELMPVASQPDVGKLWSYDLTPYRARDVPSQLHRASTGLYVHGDRHYWLHQGRLHEVVQLHTRQWQLKRTDGKAGFAPMLQWNGDHGWRLAWQRPQEWYGDAALLGHLWPLSASFDAARIQHVLKVADVGEPVLRRLVAEQRGLPVGLADTLERFSADTRINAFFLEVQQGPDIVDGELLKFCIEQLPADRRAPELSAQAILDHAPTLREKLMGHLSTVANLPEHSSVIQRDFPALPDRYAADVMARATAPQRQRLAQKGTLALALAEQARLAAHEARLCRLLQGLFLDNAYHAELPTLVFALMRREPVWPQQINFEVREATADGRLIARLHPLDVRYPPKVMVWNAGQLDVYEGAKQLFSGVSGPGGLLETMWHFLPEADRSRLGWTDGAALATLRADLQQRLPKTRGELLELLAITPPKPTFRAPTRLPDGRFGYLLSGRGGGNHHAERTLQDRVRSLFPGFNAEDLELYLQILHEQPQSPFSLLLAEEQNYQRLDFTLEHWTAEGGDVVRRPLRRAVADEIRRSWRLQGAAGRRQLNGTPGMVLILSAHAAGDLPDLTGHGGFEHVTEISVSNMQLSAVPEGFLRAFGNLLHLNLDNNSLNTLPHGLSHLPHLQELILSRNALQLTSASDTVLSGLTQLRVLDLSDNPLGAFNLALDRLPRLRQLGLRSTQLAQVPQHLTLGISLDYVDLRDNLITTLPAQLRDNRAHWRRRLALSGNTLPEEYSERWMNAARTSDSEASTGSEGSYRLRWLELLDGEAMATRTAQWDRLAEEAGSADFFRLLQDLVQTSDFRLARTDLEARVWSIFDAIEQNTALREEVFTLASQPRTCVDSVISCFSVLEVRVLAAAASGEEAASEAGLLGLARRLFRLDQVEAYARDDMLRRSAQERGVDEVEVSLAYRVGLAATLNLPGQPRTMQFGTIGGVSQQDLVLAEAVVREAEAGEALAQYISQRDFWLQYLHREHAAAFETVEAPFWARMETLDAQREGLEDGQYLAQVNQLANDREVAVTAQALELTRAALAREASSSPG
ncbi:NEL-type E3 ubiquitin ligase domain-containing protein [Pseudomonas shirazensis]|uniref:NEL-type E3 ubiquitin ligase domain-containing protein n=1 Tax=Pseudomonas shirazensis TaxID=2745494 RepID=UPI003D27C665